MQSPLALIYPAQCVSCGAALAGEQGLCGKCWSETPFITGHICDKCGAPLPGPADGAVDLCDDCMRFARPWNQGRSTLIYAENARRLVLGLKHGDRLDIVPPAAQWLARAGRDILRPGRLIVPIPAHWTRIFSRRYNQASELARALHYASGLEVAPTALYRPKLTESQEGKGVDSRFANLQGAIRPHPKRGRVLKDREIVLLDDVMTSGATFAATSEACFEAGASTVDVLALSRAVKAY
jgi:predicted amidophosphoribosyltransferase